MERVTADGTIETSRQTQNPESLRTVQNFVDPTSLGAPEDAPDNLRTVQNFVDPTSLGAPEDAPDNLRTVQNFVDPTPITMRRVVEAAQVATHTHNGGCSDHHAARRGSGTGSNPYTQRWLLRSPCGASWKRVGWHIRPTKTSGLAVIGCTPPSSRLAYQAYKD